MRFYLEVPLHRGIFLVMSFFVTVAPYSGNRKHGPRGIVEREGEETINRFVVSPLPCVHCGSLVGLDEKQLELYRSAGLYRDGIPSLSRCCYCIGGRGAVETRHDLPMRIDASYPYGVLTELPGNNWSDREWILPIKRPGPRPGFCPESPFACLTELETDALLAIADSIGAFADSRREEGRANAPAYAPPRYARFLMEIGIEAIGGGTDESGITAVYEDWAERKGPRAWILAALLLCRKGFALAAAGKESPQIKEALLSDIRGGEAQ
jgi:hypothetical protein